jgi:hypothetical protein
MKLKLALTFLAAVLIVLIISLSSQQTEPKKFVANRTFLTRSDLFFSYETTKYPSGAQVAVAQPTQERLTIGVATDPWSLNFGIIPYGDNFGTRYVDLINKKDRDVKVSLKTYGNITPFVNFSKNNFFLHPNENITIKAQFYATSAKIGNYSGQIDITVQRPKYDFLYFFWR